MKLQSRVSPAGDTAFVRVDPRDRVARGPMRVLNLALPVGIQLEAPDRGLGQGQVTAPRPSLAPGATTEHPDSLG